MPTSARTIQRRVNEMANDVRFQQTEGLNDAKIFSLVLDESVDVNDIPRLAVMARYCDEPNASVREELCCLKPMPDTTKGGDVATVITQHFDERGVNMAKIFAITTDGAPSKVGRQKGAVKLIEEKVGHPVMKLHCIIHQENLCAKMSNSDLNDVMATVAKVINFLIKRSALTHRQFRSLLEEMDSAYTDLPLHSAVRWLSCGKVLERFVSCIDAIKVFLVEKGQHYPQLEDEEWIVKLSFLADITGHLNKERGISDCKVPDKQFWTCLKHGLLLLPNLRYSSSFRYFGHLRELSSQRNISTAEITEYMRELEAEFTTRFVDFKRYGPMFDFLIKPDSFHENDLVTTLFAWMDVQDMEMQLIELKSSSLWVTKFAELRKQLESTPCNSTEPASSHAGRLHQRSSAVSKTLHWPSCLCLAQRTCVSRYFHT